MYCIGAQPAGFRDLVQTMAKPAPYSAGDNPAPLREVRGVVERITYQNPENGFTIARLLPEHDAGDEPAPRGEDNLVTIVGAMLDLTPGEAVIVQGWWNLDHKYGWQFKVKDYRTALPATIQGMRRYLGSGLIKGLGPVYAGRIVETFGEQTFAVIDDDPTRLTEVAGIGPVRAARIATTWSEQRQIREVMAGLHSYGVSTSLAVRIYKKFGDDSARVVAEEPYRLAREVWGIGFKTADKIAALVGIAADAPARLQAGVLHALGTAADDGHTLLPTEDVVLRATDLLGVEAPAIAEAIDALLVSGDLVAGARVGETAETLIALAPFARAESGLAGRLRSLAGNPGAASRVFSSVDWDVAFGWLEERHSLTLAPEQREAVRVALTTPVSILTGGPGTGKTHSLRAILALARAKKLRVVLAAPTGRAAKRMEEATGAPAATLHRALELRPGGRAERGPDNPLDADLVVVDEVSMLDVLLANQLVKAVAPGAHLLLVGDPDQLPSVGAGNVLADLLAAARFPITRLERIFRQGAGSGIAANARRIRDGQLPRFGAGVSDCFFIPAEDPSQAADFVVDLVTRRLPSRYGFSRGEIQVLAPMHRGEAGVGALNQLLQERLNPARDGVAEARSGGRVFRLGDRVLQLKNDYDLGVFNGDLGVVARIDPDESELHLTLDDGREVRYPFASLYSLTHAYAISVHKSQGAEFPAVVLPLVTSYAVLLGRTLLYTAFTRAKGLVVCVGQEKALRMAVKDWRRSGRRTALEGLLDGTLDFVWPQREHSSVGPPPAEGDEAGWEGLLESFDVGE